MKTIALFRRYPWTEIYQVTVDSSDLMMEHVKLNLPYPMLERFDVFRGTNKIITRDMERKMYDYILAYPDAIGVVLLNLSIYIVVFNSHADGFAEDNSYVPTVELPCPIAEEDLIYVGFQKTYPLIKELMVTPTRVAYSPARGAIFYNRSWHKIDYRPAEFKSKTLYHKLVNEPDYSAIVYLEDGTHKLLK